MKKIHLQYPDYILLDDAYRSLPRFGELSLIAKKSDFLTMLKNLEYLGFAGIKTSNIFDEEKSVKITACKGKRGVCYNTGRTAKYTGVALVAYDDDNHFLFSKEEIPVCEKTAFLYTFPTYQNCISISETDIILFSKLNDDPEIFSCDNFESDQEKIYQILKQKAPETDRVDLYYPGPFKLLILRDGTIVYRGVVNRVPKLICKDLIEIEGLISVELDEKYENVFFQNIYNNLGPRWILEISTNPVVERKTETVDFNALSAISVKLKNHLISVIDQNKKYFILTGSDKNNPLGCCPSDEVTEANELVKKGILNSYQEPGTEDACPVIIYAFNDEIKNNEKGLFFESNTSFRKKVNNFLSNNPKKYVATRIVKWFLIAFLSLSVLLALIKIFDSKSFSEANLYDVLQPSNQNKATIVLFHYTKRCKQCLSMEKLTNEVIDEHFAEIYDKKILEFKLIEIDKNENKYLVEHLELFTATLVLANFEKERDNNIKVLNKSWELIENEISFKEMVKNELEIYLNLNND